MNDPGMATFRASIVWTAEPRLAMEGLTNKYMGRILIEMYHEHTSAREEVSLVWGGPEIPVGAGALTAVLNILTVADAGDRVEVPRSIVGRQLPNTHGEQIEYLGRTVVEGWFNNDQVSALVAVDGEVKKESVSTQEFADQCLQMARAQVVRLGGRTK